MTTDVSLGRQTTCEVSMIVAIRNEEGFIEKCLESLLCQDIPQDSYEIIVIDGMSTDKTPQIIDRYRNQYPEIVKVFTNPERIQTIGWNIGIRHSCGEFIQIIGGHSYLESNYVRILLESLKNSGSEVAGIGGIHVPPNNEDYLGKVIGNVQGSLLGGAGTSFRSPKFLKAADTVVFPVYKRKVLDTVGLYDERFDIAEDVELNWRIRKAGFKLLVCPRAVAYYYRKHSTFVLFFKRMIRYGVWRARVMKKHPSSFKPLFLIPILLSIAPLLLTVFLIASTFLAESILLGLIIYLLAVLISSTWLSIQKRHYKYMISVIFYVLEHFGIGVGFMAGLLKKFPTSRTNLK